VNGRTIRSLTVVAGPTAVGKTRLLQLLAADDQLRERLRMPKGAPTITAGQFLRSNPVGSIDHLIVHYDILRPHNKRFGSHAADPGTSFLRHAEAIAFFTLRTAPDLLASQLDRRIALHKHPPKKLRKLQPLYEDDRFLADWYERWFRFLERFRDVTTTSYIVDAQRDYRLTAVTAPTLSC
jgi:hypothetical protein